MDQRPRTCGAGGWFWVWLSRTSHRRAQLASMQGRIADLAASAASGSRTASASTPYRTGPAGGVERLAHRCGRDLVNASRGSPALRLNCTLLSARRTSAASSGQSAARTRTRSYDAPLRDHKPPDCSAESTAPAAPTAPSSGVVGTKKGPARPPDRPRSFRDAETQGQGPRCLSGCVQFGVVIYAWLCQTRVKVLASRRPS